MDIGDEEEILAAINGMNNQPSFAFVVPSKPSKITVVESQTITDKDEKWENTLRTFTPTTTPVKPHGDAPQLKKIRKEVSATVEPKKITQQSPSHNAKSTSGLQVVEASPSNQSVTMENATAIYTEKNSKIVIKPKPQSSSSRCSKEQWSIMTQVHPFISFATVQCNSSKALTSSTIGVIVHLSASKNGYGITKLWNMHGSSECNNPDTFNPEVLSVLVSGACFVQYYSRMSVGDVVAVARLVKVETQTTTAALEKRNFRRSKNELFKVSELEQLLVFGRAPNLQLCSAVCRSTQEPCRALVNVSELPFCSYHLSTAKSVAKKRAPDTKVPGGKKYVVGLPSNGNVVGSHNPVNRSPVLLSSASRSQLTASGSGDLRAPLLPSQLNLSRVGPPPHALGVTVRGEQVLSAAARQVDECARAAQVRFLMEKREPSSSFVPMQGKDARIPKEFELSKQPRASTHLPVRCGLAALVAAKLKEKTGKSHPNIVETASEKVSVNVELVQQAHVDEQSDTFRRAAQADKIVQAMENLSNQKVRTVYCNTCSRHCMNASGIDDCRSKLHSLETRMTLKYFFECVLCSWRVAVVGDDTMAHPFLECARCKQRGNWKRTNSAPVANVPLSAIQCRADTLATVIL